MPMMPHYRYYWSHSDFDFFNSFECFPMHKNKTTRTIIFMFTWCTSQEQFVIWRPSSLYINSETQIFEFGPWATGPKIDRKWSVDAKNRNQYFRIDSWVQWYMEGKSVLSTKTFFVFLKSHILTDPSPPRDERQVLSYENVTLLISVIGLCAFWILIRGATVRLWSQIWIWPSFAPLAIILPFLKIILRFEPWLPGKIPRVRTKLERDLDARNPREFRLMIFLPVICYASRLCSFSLSIFHPPDIVMFYHDAAKHVFFSRFNIPLTYRTIIWGCDVPSPLIRMENTRVYHGLVTWSLCSVHKIIVTFYRSCDKKAISIV